MPSSQNSIEKYIDTVYTTKWMGVGVVEDSLKEFRAKYGTEVATEVESRFVKPLRTFVVQVKAMDDALRTLLGSFRSSEMVSVADFLRAPFKDSEARLRTQGKMLLVYKSTPSAVIFDVKRLEELQEDLDAVRAIVEREITEGDWIAPEDFWKAVDETRPRHRQSGD